MPFQQQSEQHVKQIPRKIQKKTKINPKKVEMARITTTRK